MTPQLFINYKLKSVAHLPWRMMTYKALNTFIDDLFAFVIKMPTLYRLGCFRDGRSVLSRVSPFVIHMFLSSPTYFPPSLPSSSLPSSVHPFIHPSFLPSSLPPFPLFPSFPFIPFFLSVFLSLTSLPFCSSQISYSSFTCISAGFIPLISNE